MLKTFYPLLVTLLNISLASAGYATDRSPAWSLSGPTAADRDVTVEIGLSRGKRDLLYWNRASNSFRKYGRNRDLRTRTSKLEKNDKTENLMAQIRKYYVRKEKGNPEKVQMIKNIIRSIEKSDKNLKFSAQLTKNQK